LGAQNPTLEIVFSPDEILDFAIVGDVIWGQLGFPVPGPIVNKWQFSITQLQKLTCWLAYYPILQDSRLARQTMYQGRWIAL